MNLLLLPLKVFLLSLDFVIMAVTFGWVKSVKKMLDGKKVASKPLGDDESHRVGLTYKEVQDTEGCKTMYDITNRSIKKYGSLPCLKSREYLGVHQEKPLIRKFGESSTRTYAEVGDAAYKFGAALRKAGLVSAPDVATIDAIDTPCSLAIFENTCPEWLMAAIGSHSQSVIVTTIYATLGLNAVMDAIRDGAISAILCNKRNVSKLTDRIKEIPTLKTIIYTNDYIAATDESVELPEAPPGVTIVSFDDFVASGDTVAFPAVPPKPESCAVVMYTSGSTGKPKGVILDHRALVSSCYSMTARIGIRQDDIFLGYLPLAHIFEMAVEFAVFSQGACISYACPKTLTTKGAYPTGALEHYGPSLMVGVPKVWDIIKKGAEAKIAASKPIARFLVETAFEARKFAISCGWDTPLFKALVFKKFSKLVGGNLRLAGSGGGPLNSEVQIFIRTAFGCSLVQGYGLTETVSSLSMQEPYDLALGSVGPPNNCVQVKLKSTPEINDKAGVPYLSTDKHDVDGNVVYGRGEILVKGPNILTGYYLMPEETKKVMEDGFFKTGDVGQFMEDGGIRIVDRVKNLVKLKGGEYIAVERMEMCYGNSKYVDAAQGGLLCYGDGDMDRPIAMMHLNEDLAMKWAQANGVTGDFATVKQSKQMEKEVLSSMIGEWKKAGLSHLEKLVAVAFLDGPWTPENGCLTAANKIQRKTIVSTFAEDFNKTKAKAIF